MLKLITKITDYFLPAGASLLSAEQLRKTKMLINSALLCAYFAYSYGAISYLIDFYIGIYCMFVLGTICLLLLYWLKLRNNYNLVANLFIALTAIATLVLVYAQGGVTAGVTTPWANFVLAMSILLVGIRNSRYWLLFTLAYFIALFVLEYTGHTPAALYNTTYATTFRLSSYVGLSVVLFIVINVFEQTKNKAIDQLNNKNRELEETLDKLKETQEQLIQQEKLASLGQLTAGIAHEMRNPLNFVNNFSKISAEIIEEFETEKDIAERARILDDLKQNLTKINFHGKRADVIVKSMLDHARVTDDQKTETDINKLCEEYLTLAYHGVKANVSDFNCELKRDFEKDLPVLHLVQQDISRVILNLLNNAFYAVKGAKEPEVLVRTRREGNEVVITVRDNGSGIPAAIREKIFEPFFTTKPTGRGTGLGLSISYDIIKSHGGDLKVDSKENEFTEFRISLPIA